MKAVISLSIAGALIATCQSVSAESPMGVLRFKGALVGSTGVPAPGSNVASTDEGPHRLIEQTLGAPASTRAELLDYFLATRRDVGIDARELKLFTRTYL